MDKTSNFYVVSEIVNESDRSDLFLRQPSVNLSNSSGTVAEESEFLDQVSLNYVVSSNQEDTVNCYSEDACYNTYCNPNLIRTHNYSTSNCAQAHTPTNSSTSSWNLDSSIPFEESQHASIDVFSGEMDNTMEAITGSSSLELKSTVHISEAANANLQETTASTVPSAHFGIADYILDESSTAHQESAAAMPIPSGRNKAITLRRKLKQPWYCVSRPISEQTRDIKISSINTSSSIYFSRLLQKCRSIVEFCTSLTGEEELSEQNIEKMNYNHSWGDSLPSDVKGHTIRVVYQNVHRSISASDNPQTNNLLDNLNDMEADVFMASESNINWKSATCRNDFKQKVSRVWPMNKVAFSTSDVGLEFEGHEYLPGGTCTIAVDNLSMRVTKVGEDMSGLGRWSFITMEGQDGRKVTFITAYRICSGPIRGTRTVGQQQSKIINNQEMRNGTSTSKPDANFLRMKLVEDLVVFIQALKAEGHAIVLGLDANETPMECQKSNEIKYGSISWLLAQTELKEVFEERHNEAPDSTTTTPGRFIDRVAVYGIPIHRVTLLNAHCPAKSDHLGIVIDLDLRYLFNNACSPLAFPSPRKLTSGNAASVNKYVAFIRKQFEIHKIFDRCRRLREACDNDEFTEDHRKLLFALDNQVTEILLGAENKCSTKRQARNLWSPALKKSGQEISYWRQRISTKGLLDGSTRDLGNKLQIPAILQQTLTPEVCKFYLDIAWKSYNGVKKQAREHRMKFLKERAKEQAAKGKGTVEKAIKQIRHREQLKMNYATIRKGYGINRMGLVTLDVPDPDTGGRKLITDADAIHNYLLQRNERHFGQATYTTFGDAGPGYQYIDPTNPDSDKHIDEMLEGVFEPWPSASPYVREFLKELQCTVTTEMNTKLHLQDFIDLFKKIPENTASSVSGLHYGHYKVLSKLEDESIIRVLFDIVNMAFITHSPLPRWQHVTQLMLEKGKGPGIENLRVIQLLEADLNWLLRFLWGKKLEKHAQDNGVYNESQFASPGKLCQSAILNKVLFFDILRQNRHYGALIDNDATAAFDRVLPALCVVTCRQLGMPKHAQRFFFKMLRQTIYTTTTAHGRSTATYSASANPKVPGQGVMQGGGASLPNYKSQQLPVLRAYERNCTPAVLCHASRVKAKFRQWISGFSDDVSLFLNELGVRLSGEDTHLPMVQRMRNAIQTNLERYEEYFFTAGGALNIKKCFYYFIGFHWTGTEWRYKTNHEMQVEPIYITPTTLENDARPQQVQWCEANNAQRTLGSFLAPDGSVFRQLEVLSGKFAEWKSCLQNISSSNVTAKWLSYTTVFLKKIMYPLIGHSCSPADLESLQKLTDREVLHILGLNEHFPRAVLYAPLVLGGMGCTTIHGQHVIEKVVLFLHHMREKGKIHETLMVSMSTTQLECGSATPFFSLDAGVWSALVTKTWISHIWEECRPLGIEIRFHTECYWVPKPVREGDVCIMDVASTMYNGEKLRQLNMCRVALKVTFLSDIASVDGKRILLAYYQGKPHSVSGRVSRLNWPPVGDLPKQWWLVWQEFLEKWCGTALNISPPLGRWYAEAEMLTKCCCFLYEGRLVVEHRGDLFEFLPFTERSRTRFQKQAYPLDDSHSLSQAMVVDVSHREDSIYIVAKSAQNIIRQTPEPEVHNLRDLYRNLSPELQRIVGSVEWPDMESMVDIVNAITHGTGMGVSDGSVRPLTGKATHAWIFQAGNGSAISGSGPVDGTPNTCTSHRAEIQGSAALLIILSLIVKFFNITRGKISTYCDNQSVVSKLQRGWRTWRFRHTKGPDGDLQALLRQVTEEIRSSTNITQTSEWVQGHQDSKAEAIALTRQAKLNIRMDEQAKQAYDLLAQWQTLTYIPVLHAEVCAVYIGDVKITSNVHLSLAEQWHEREARAYLLQRHNITTELFPTINWQSLRYALKKFNAHRRATAVKALHRHLPSQEKLFKQGRVTMSSLCPRCLQEEETNSHVYCCDNEEALKQRKADWVEFWKQMAKGRTASIIEQTWRYYLQPILHIPLGSSIIEGLTIAHGDLAELLSLAIREQTEIGWEKLLLGLGSTTWKTIQNVIDASNPKPPKRSASAWMNASIHQLLKFSLRCWKARNSKIHGSTKQEQQQKALQNVRDQIRDIYAHPPKLATHFRPIFEIPLEHRLKLSLQAAEQWISLIRHQAKVTTHNFHCLVKQHASIKTHFRTMRREARSQAKERQLPETPRKAHRRAVQAAVKEMREKLYKKRRAITVTRSRRMTRNRLPSDGGETGKACGRRSRSSNTEQRPPLRHHPP